jgi:hypothetical protein
MDAFPNYIALEIQFHSHAGFKYASIHLIRPIVSSNLVFMMLLVFMMFAGQVF